MRLYKNILLIIAVLCVSNTFGQQEWGYTLNMFNLYDINSAYAGSFKEVNINGRYRYQWTGIDGAPHSQMISTHLPLFQNVGFGVKLFNESIGVRNRLSAKATVSYKLPLRTGYLGVAFNGGVLSHRYNLNELVSKGEIDNILNSDNESGSAITFDFSMLWYSNDYFVGLEIENINQAAFFPGAFTDLEQVRHFLFTGGYAFEINEDFIFRPTAAIKSIAFDSFSPELHLSVFLNKKLWLGSGYRLNGSLLFFSELNISEKFRIGYSYDFGLGDLGVFSPSSHEVFLGLRIKNDAAKGTSIRYFK